MQQTEVEQAKEKELAYAWQKLSGDGRGSQFRVEGNLKVVLLAFLLIAEDKGGTAEGKGRTDNERCHAETGRERAGD